MGDVNVTPFAEDFYPMAEKDFVPNGECEHTYKFAGYNDYKCAPGAVIIYKCSQCKKLLHKAYFTEHVDADTNYICDVCGTEMCRHETTVTVPAVSPKCFEDGMTAYTYCDICHKIISEPEIIKAYGEHIDEDNNGVCDRCGEKTEEEPKTFIEKIIKTFVAWLNKLLNAIRNIGKKK